MNGTLTEKREIANGTGVFRFRTDEDVPFVPGQYFHIKFRDDLKHHFTISNSPNEPRIISLTTRLRDTEFKNALRSLPIGGTAEIYKINGEFTLPERISEPIVFIALGIGITPYISMLRYLDEEGRLSGITLIYSDSDAASMAYVSELEELSRTHDGFRLIITITGDPAWSGERRRVDAAFVREYIPGRDTSRYYVSGPPDAVVSVGNELRKLGIAQDRIKSEEFPGY